MNIARIIRANLNVAAPTLFVTVLSEIERHASQPAHNLQQLRDRRRMTKNKGDAWEEFCALYLRHSGKYQHVWMWSELGAALRTRLRIPSKQDNGIDIVALTHAGQYHAIQCKYRGDRARTVTWASLATFVGMCAVTGPREQNGWGKHIVMTNCRGVTRKVPRTPKDQTLAFGTFNAIKPAVWRRMAGLVEEAHIVGKLDVNDNDNNNVNDDKRVNAPPQSMSIRELRELRLEKFG